MIAGKASDCDEVQLEIICAVEQIRVDLLSRVLKTERKEKNAFGKVIK